MATKRSVVEGTTASIAGIGLIALDLVMSADPTRPVRAWTGGTCGNVLTIMSYLGWHSFPVARLNADIASLRVKQDMTRWGVHLNFAGCDPTCSTPIVVQKIDQNRRGEPTHRFAWSCPHCGKWLPGYRAVTAKAAEEVSRRIPTPNVFFMDRLSRGGLVLAQAAAAAGALIVFEPSGRSEPGLLQEALRLSHIVKYAEGRVRELGTSVTKSSVVLEIQTLGDHGLRYRTKRPVRSTLTGWRHLPPLSPPAVRDTCGAGDWCTAGILSAIGQEGLGGFQSSTQAQIHSALKRGQAMAAWTCAFEGARGGMYYVSRDEFWKQITAILRGKSGKPLSNGTPYDDAASAVWLCPACTGSSAVKAERSEREHPAKHSGRQVRKAGG